MGNSQNRKKLNDISKLYSEREMGYLDQIFHEMALRSPNDKISKDTFIRFFNLPGILGEKLFDVFDTKKIGEIDFEEFIVGYHKFSRGTPETKLNMLFQLFDLGNTGGITRDELKMVLLSIVTPPNQIMSPSNLTTNIMENSCYNNSIKSSDVSTKISNNLRSNEFEETCNNISIPGNQTYSLDSPQLIPLSGSPTPDLLQSRNSNNAGNNDFDSNNKIMEEVEKKVNDLVKQAFDECDVDDNGLLDIEEFKQFFKKNHEIIAICEEIFVQLAWNAPQQISIRAEFDVIKAEYLNQQHLKLPGTNSHMNNMLNNISRNVYCEDCKLRFVTKMESLSSISGKKNSDQWEYAVMSHATNENCVFEYCPRCGQKLQYLQPISKVKIDNISLSSIKDPGVPNLSNYHEGNLKVPHGKLRMLKTKFVSLHGKFLYLFKHKDKEFPETVLFIQGYFVTLKPNEYHYHHLIKLLPPQGSHSRTFSLYATDLDIAKKWVEKIQIAAETVAIEKYYDLGKTLGKGSFAEVCEATEKQTGRKVAVKVIQKKFIDGKQKEYIRIEMSILKLVKHPNVVKLEQIFETKSKIFMVIPLYSHDLYEYMKKNARHGLSEHQARFVIYRIIHTLRYLHSIGIIHRDLKPENLLLKKEDDPTDIVVTDFGLSKFASPHEAIKAACGTLSYVAPEVLKMEGYGKEVDIWSCGVIMFLILRAKLPFHDDAKNKIIAKILREDIEMNDIHWSKISNEAKDLINRFLVKNPSTRITCEEALQHSWFDPIRSFMQQESQKSHKINNNLSVSNSISNVLSSNRELHNEKNKHDTNNHYGKHKNTDIDSSDYTPPLIIIRRNSIRE